MEKFILQTQPHFSSYLGLVSFSIGTLLFLAHLAFPDTSILIPIGILYVVIAFFINLIMFLALGFLFITNPTERERIAIRMLILLANIPVAGLYLMIIINHNF